MSWALIHVTRRAPNSVNIERYFNRAFPTVNLKNGTEALRICVLHTWSTCFPSSSRRRTARWNGPSCTLSFVYTATGSETMRQIRRMCILFGHENITVEVQKALSLLDDAINQTKDKEIELGGRQYSSDDVKKRTADQKTIRQSEKYFHSFNIANQE